MQTVVLIGSGEGEVAALADALGASGFIVNRADDVLRGLELTKEKAPDLFVCLEQGLRLRGMDLLALVRSDGRFDHTRVAVIAATAEESEALLEAGCDEVFAEVEPREIVRRLRARMTKGAEPKVRSSGLEGDLSQIGLLDIIQLLLASRRDGVLRFEAQGREGELVFRIGQIIDAHVGEHGGEAALLEGLSLTLKGGTFSFTAADTSTTTATLTERTEHLLMRLANAIDEGSTTG